MLCNSHNLTSVICLLHLDINDEFLYELELLFLDINDEFLYELELLFLDINDEFLHELKLLFLDINDEFLYELELLFFVHEYCYYFYLISVNFYYITLIILLNIAHSFSHSWMIPSIAIYH